MASSCEPKRHEIYQLSSLSSVRWATYRDAIGLLPLSEGEFQHAGKHRRPSFPGVATRTRPPSVRDWQRPELLGQGQHRWVQPIVGSARQEQTWNCSWNHDAV